MKWIAKFAALGIAAMAFVPGALAQSCAMCYATAQAQDARAARHLDYAILTLLIPSVSLFAAVFIAAMRRSYRASGESQVPVATPHSSGPDLALEFPSRPSPALSGYHARRIVAGIREADAGRVVEHRNLKLIFRSWRHRASRA